MMNGISEFRDFIASLGFTAPDRIEPGQFVRFSANGKPGNSSASAKLFPDLEGGIVWNWATGDEWLWQAKREQPRTPAEMQAYRERCEKAKRDAAAERERELKETAERAEKIWREAKPADDSHPYLVSKGVPCYGLRIYRGTFQLRGMRCEGALIVPRRTAAGDLVSLQFIAPNGDKRYLNGPVPGGAYFSIGKPDGKLYVAEGYATAASIHVATGGAVAVTFDAGNMLPAAAALHAKLPDVRLILCADDDWRATRNGEPYNPGVEAATAAAHAVGGLIAVPVFGADRPESATDFNDAHKLHGEQAVRDALEAAQAPQQTAPVSHGQPPAENRAPAYVEVSRLEDCAPRVELQRGSSMAPVAVDWLWNGWLAKRKLHILAGPPGTGKTTLTMAIAAAFSNGGQLPDRSSAPIGSVVIWSGEDGISDTLLPRLIACGADADKIHFVTAVQDERGKRSFDPAQDVPLLMERLGDVPDVVLIVVDPIVSAVAADSNKNAEVRRALQPLVDFAEARGCAVLGISHFSKGTQGRDPVDRVTGSLAFGAAARVVLAAFKVTEPDNGPTYRMLVRAKSNIGLDDGGFKYDVEAVPVPGHPEIQTTRVRWGQFVQGTARELLAQAEVSETPEDRSERESVIDFVRTELQHGPRSAGEIIKAGEALGFSRRSIQRASDKLQVVKGHSPTLAGGWTWSLSKMPKNAEGDEDASRESQAPSEELAPSGADAEVFR